MLVCFFFSSRRRHTRLQGDWSSDVCSSDLAAIGSALGALIDHWIVCALPGARGGSAAQLAQRLGSPAAETTLADSVAAGCERARAAARPGDRVVVCGSVYTVGPALQWLRIY